VGGLVTSSNTHHHHPTRINSTPVAQTLVYLKRETCSSGDEFEELVQRALAANAGVDFRGWGALLSHAARGALARASKDGGSGGRLDAAPPPLLQALFELQRAARLLRTLLAAAARALRHNVVAAAAPRRRAGEWLQLGSGGALGGGLQARVTQLTIGSGSTGNASAGAASSSGEPDGCSGLPLGPLAADDLAALPRDGGGWAQQAAGLLEEVLGVLGGYGVVDRVAEFDQMTLTVGIAL
jgi:hypothetical protein